MDTGLAENGWGVPQNLAEAAKWYKASAEQNHQFGQNNLGWCYENGLGVEKSVVEAAKWYRRAAIQGHPHGQNNLGRCYGACVCDPTDTLGRRRRHTESTRVTRGMVNGLSCTGESVMYSLHSDKKMCGDDVDSI